MLRFMARILIAFAVYLGASWGVLAQSEFPSSKGAGLLDRLYLQGFPRDVPEFVLDPLAITCLFGPDCRDQIVEADDLPEDQILALITFGAGIDPDCNSFLCPNETACTAFAIGPRHLMTSAHCIREGNRWQIPRRILVGLNRGPNGDVAPLGNCRPTQVCHPATWDWENSAIQDDIGLIAMGGDGCELENTLGITNATQLEEVLTRAAVVGYMPQPDMPRVFFETEAEFLRQPESVREFVPQQVYNRLVEIGPWHLAEGAICHNASAVAGSSGSPVLAEDDIAAFCVHSRSFNQSRLCGLDLENTCSAITSAVEGDVREWLNSEALDDRTEGLTCHDIN